jgi:hypothetical protein
MPKDPALLPSGVRRTDLLTATQFAAVFPIFGIREVLEECGRATIRVRDFPNEAVIYFVMMLALFRNCSHREVFRIIAVALSQLWKRKQIVIPTPAALSKARSRVGDEPFEKLFKRFAVTVAIPSTKGAWFKGWRKTAIDGCLLNTEDTKENRQHFGCASNQHKTTAAWPQARFVGLMELGAHVFVDAAIGGYRDGEIALAQKLIPQFTPEMICIADRNFFSFDLFQKIGQTGAAFLVRVQRGLSLASEKTFADRSDLVTIYSPDDVKKEHGLKARFIQYTVVGSKSKEKIFLLTNILDPRRASAQELAQLYDERWEYEGALDELKVHLNANAVTLRSKRPDLVKQELWGMLMTHYVVRLNMHQAAIGAKLDPDELSFTHTVKVIGRSLLQSTSAFPPSEQTPQDAQ